MPDASLRILAEPADAHACTFTVERPVLPDGAVRFGSPGAAQGSPLAEALFAVPGVVSVAAAGRKVVVRKSGDEDWGPTARAIGAAIREKVLAGGPLVADAALRGTPADRALGDRVSRIVETEVNPVVAGHGGRIGIVGVRDGAVFVVMSGGCQGCGMAHITLRQGVERLVRERFPEVVEVVDVTDHGAGLQPYAPRQG